MLRHRHRIVLFVLLTTALGGCELIATFDRGKLDGSVSDMGSSDLGTPDMPAADLGSDADVDMAGIDLGVDDLGVDADIDAGLDAGDVDAGDVDAGTDAGDVDAGTDAGDVDAGTDAGTDAGDVDAGTDAGTDAGPPPCAVDLAPADDGSGAARQALVVAELAPGSFVELYNNSASDIVLSAGTFVLVSGTDVADLATLGATVTVVAHGRATLPWPAAFTDVAAGGEVLLFTDATTTDPTHIMDFVCWGTVGHASLQADAETGGKWTAAAACAGALTMGAIARLPATTGLDATAYDVASAPSPEACIP